MVIETGNLGRYAKDLQHCSHGNFGAISKASWTDLTTTVRDKMQAISRIEWDLNENVRLEAKIGGGEEIEI